MAIQQYSTINALMLGHYQKIATVKVVLKTGNLGIGTFEGMYGEAIIIDGKCYIGMPGGKVEEAKPEMGMAFATVGDFSMAGTIFQVSDVENIETLKLRADEVRKAETKSPNYPCLCRIDGRFNNVRVRAIAKQEEPYKPLSEVSKLQVETVSSDIIEGTVVGIWFPEYVAGLNLAGWHFHFISRDRKTLGGHLLECSLVNGLIGAKKETTFSTTLPDDEAFRNLEFTNDLVEDLQKVENQSQAK